MALGANVCMPPDRVHRREIVIDAGDGFSTVALATGEVGPGRVDVAGFCYVAVLTPPAPIKFNAPVGVCQVGSAAHSGRCRAVREKATADPRYSYQRSLMARPGFVLFLITGANFVLLVTPDG